MMSTRNIVTMSQKSWPGKPHEQNQSFVLCSKHYTVFTISINTDLWELLVSCKIDTGQTYSIVKWFHPSELQLMIPTAMNST